VRHLKGFAIVVALLVVACAPSFAEGDEVTLTGQFVWERDDGNHSGDLKAVFTPTGKKTWNVSFYFEWEDGRHVYEGTAEGSLTKGELKGEVVNDNKERPGTFRFKGKFKDGVFEGRHGSVRDGKENELGTLTLSAG